MANKRKTTTAIVAGVTAAALLLGGTFAWTSISQQAKNEAIVDINPGGRLHDDFNGTNKDVYVENFGDDETGVPIFARIRLYEYMEIGQQAGNKTIADADRKAKPLIEGDTIDDHASWEIYKYQNENSAFAKYWSWKLGNDDAATLPYYMPTFNMNKDSLAADINGTYEGTVNGDIVHYDDYTAYGDGSTKTDTEVYDHDSNTNEEVEDTVDGVPAYSTTDPNAPIDDAHVYLNEGQTHTAEQITSTSTVMSMEEWITAGSPIEPIWVFDEDGWAYWAQPIDVGETTGLLLDSIQMTKVPDDSWYYGINVVAQFATASDLSAFNKDGESFTDNALALLNKVSGQEIDAYPVIMLNSGVETVMPLAAGETAKYKLGFAEDEESGEIDPSSSAIGSAKLYNPMSFSEGKTTDIAWENGTASYSYNPQTQVLTVTQNNTSFNMETGEKDESEEPVPVVYGASFEINCGEANYSVRFAVPTEAVISSTPSESYTCADIYIASYQEYIHLDTESYGMTGLQLSGIYNNGITYDEETKLLYVPKDLLPNVAFTGSLTLEGGSGSIDAVAYCIRVPENSDEHVAMMLNLDDLTYDNDSNTYTGTVVDYWNYGIIDPQNAESLLKLQPTDTLAEGLSIAGPIQVKTNDIERSISVLCIPEYFAEEPTIINLSATCLAGETYNIILTVVGEPVDEQSVDITAADLTLDLTGDSMPNKEGTITAAGTYEFDVAYDTALGMETTVTWELSTYDGAEGTVTVDASAGTVTVAEGATGTWYLTPVITCGTQQVISNVSATLTINITADATV